MDKINWLLKKDQGLANRTSTNPARITDSELKIQLDGGPVHVSFPPNTGYVYLLLDCSSSMSGHNKLGQAKERSIDFARQAQFKGYFVGLITFNTNAANICDPQPETSVLKKHLATIEAEGTTNMGRGIRLATNKLKSLPGQLCMVIVTDGAPNSKQNALKLAGEAKNAGIEIITIGTDDADEEFLRLLASRKELAAKVIREQLGQAIADAAKMLPAPDKRLNLRPG